MGRFARENELLDLIYGAVADPQQWPEILTRVSDHLSADGGMLVYNAMATGQSFQVLGRLSEELSEIYRKYHVVNPWTVAMQDVPFGRAVLANSLVEPGAIGKTAFYSDVVKPARQVDMFCVSHREMARNGGVGGFGFTLSERGAERAEESLKKLQRLTPHLSRAFDATLQIGRYADGAHQLGSVLQAMPNAALLLNGRGHVVHANPAAETLLDSKDGLEYDRNGIQQLSASMPGERPSLSRAIAEALGIADGSGSEFSQPLRLARPSGSRR